MGWVLRLREGWRLCLSSFVFVLFRTKQRASAESLTRRKNGGRGTPIKKSDLFSQSDWVGLIYKFFFFVIMTQNGDSFLEKQVVGVDDDFAVFGFQKDMKGMDVFDFGYNREIFVMNPDDVPDFNPERKEQYDSRSDIAQDRPLGKQGGTHNGNNGGYGNKDIFGLHSPDND